MKETITQSAINEFCSSYVDLQGLNEGSSSYDHFALADALANAFNGLNREEFYHLVTKCEKIIEAKIGYVSPFANLIEAKNAWTPF
jgi:hypothetical protein